MRDPQADSKTREGMNPLCDNGEYDLSHHVEHTKQAASLQSQLTNQQRHLYDKVANNLDNCLLTLADGHDHVMKAMIGELRDIVDSGYVQTFPHILAFGKLSIQSRSLIKKALHDRFARKTFNPVTVIHQGNAP